MRRAREVRLARWPQQRLAAEDFELVGADLPALADGLVLVENICLSVDPYMRLPLTPMHGVHVPMRVGDTMGGAALGIVTESRHAAFPVGTHVVHPTKGWRDAYVDDGARLSPIDPADGPLSWHLGVLGMTGITAFAGLELVLDPQPGESVFVSGAAGAVGSIACQLAKRRGCRVLGSAGSPDKLRWLTDELEVDAVVDYRRDDVGAFLARQCPDGLDAYFDNVGGKTLETVLDRMRNRGRVALCGAIAQYDDANYRAGPANFFAVIEKGLVLEGINVMLYADRSAEIVARLAALAGQGALVVRETRVEGLDNMVSAFLAMLGGDNTGKMVVLL